MQNLALKYISAEEYFILDEASEIKHEYYDGEIFAFVSASRIHNMIVSNLIGIFHTLFKSKPCVVFPPEMRVRIEEGKYYTYPDISIVCGEAEFAGKKENTLLNPNLIIEVLSDSTEPYDRKKKFQAYRSIPSLNTYILVSTDYKLIEVYSKNPLNSWTLTEPDKDGKVLIPSIDFILNQEEVYDKVIWKNEEIL